MRTGASPDAVGELLLWCGLGVAGFVVLALFAWWIRRRMFGVQPEADGGVLDLNTLQRLRDAGTISETEYKALRAAAIRGMGNDGNRGTSC